MTTQITITDTIKSRLIHGGFKSRDTFDGGSEAWKTVAVWTRFSYEGVWKHVSIWNMHADYVGGKQMKAAIPGGLLCVARSSWTRGNSTRTDVFSSRPQAATQVYAGTVFAAATSPHRRMPTWHFFHLKTRQVTMSSAALNDLDNKTLSFCEICGKQSNGKHKSFVWLF